MTNNPKQAPQAARKSALHASGVFPAFKALTDLYLLDDQIRNLREAPSKDGKLAELLGRRAKSRLAFGFSELALTDMRESRALRSGVAGGKALESIPSHVDDARLAEILRVDARDRLLSKTRADEFCAAVSQSIELFASAQGKFAKLGNPDRKQAAWISAHLAAAHTMNYWIEISVNPGAAGGDLGADDFRKAEANFKDAIRLDPTYEWAIRFQAFLYALRGRPSEEPGKGDFESAIELLQIANQVGASSSVSSQLAPGPSVPASPQAAQSSLQRSLSMLFSYVAVQSSSEEAAQDSIAAGLQAMALDPEEFHAPHSVAASLFWLAHYANSNAERTKHAAYLQPAIESARVRAKNSVSQAAAVLASLALIDALQTRGDVTEAVKKASQILDGFEAMGIPTDLETRAFSYRTPSVALLRKLLEQPPPPDDSNPDRYTKIRAFEAIIENLTSKLSIARKAS